jgi:hypothetical protein
MSITQVTSLLTLAKAFSDGSVQQIVMVGSQYFSNGTIDGQSVLLPNWTGINALVAQYFPS